MYQEELIGDDVMVDLPSMTANQGRSKLLAVLRGAINQSDQKAVVMSNILTMLEETREPSVMAVASKMRAFWSG